MLSFTPPPCISRSEVALICQEAEGGQIYNDSREQHRVTTVNIYTALTKDVAKVCRGSKPCRNYNQPHIINHLKTAQVQWKAWFVPALSPRRQQTGMLLKKSVLLCAPIKQKRCYSGYLPRALSPASRVHAAIQILETPSWHITFSHFSSA